MAKLTNDRATRMLNELLQVPGNGMHLALVLPQRRSTDSPIRNLRGLQEPISTLVQL
jgi:hypothetical protein